MFFKVRGRKGHQIWFYGCPFSLQSTEVKPPHLIDEGSSVLYLWYFVNLNSPTDFGSDSDSDPSRHECISW